MNEPDTQNRLRGVYTGLLHAARVLIQRGTVMGPLVLPLLVAGLVLLPAASLLRNVAVYHGLPVISAALVLASLWTLFHYLSHYSRFAKRDPDRLQSETHQLEMRRMQYLTGKDRLDPLTPDVLERSAQNPEIPNRDAEPPPQETP